MALSKKKTLKARCAFTMAAVALTVAAGGGSCVVMGFSHNRNSVAFVLTCGAPKRRVTRRQQRQTRLPLWLSASSSSATTTTTTTTISSSSSTSAADSICLDNGFIAVDLRGAAMKLHTKSQAKEGEAPEAKKEPYIPTIADYVQFLVDSKHVYEALEDIVNEVEELAVYRQMPLERTLPLERDLAYLTQQFPDLEIPAVGEYGREYAMYIRGLRQSVPKFLCHFYNFYFAHTAGGRMIGKQMANLLLDGYALDFYKWDGNLKEIKDDIKLKIETMVATTFSEQDRQDCVNETAEAFRGGGAINAYLDGGGHH